MVLKKMRRIGPTTRFIHRYEDVSIKLGLSHIYGLGEDGDWYGWR